MSVLSDKWIRKMSKEEGMISPFEEKQVRGDSISYGLSSFGYDARVSDEFKIFTNVNSEIVDPKNFKPTNFVTKNVSECIIPPNSFVLARTVEKFKIPNDVLVICLGKSTYARCGIIHSDTFFVTKLVGLKFLGSTISELTFVKILNSSETLAS